MRGQRRGIRSGKAAGAQRQAEDRNRHASAEAQRGERRQHHMGGSRLRQLHASLEPDRKEQLGAQQLIDGIRQFQVRLQDPGEEPHGEKEKQRVEQILGHG
jgi:hypothetical protein